MSRTIIDLRSRPSYLHPFYGSTPGTPGHDTAVWLNQRVGSQEPQHFERGYTLDGFVQEIRDAGITAAAIIGRDTPSVATDNDTVARLVAGRPELIGVGSVDPQRQGVVAALTEAERAVNSLGLKAINLEPGFLEPPRPFDDPIFHPIYDLCAQLAVPVCLMTGPTTPDLDYARPEPIGRVARAFPKLNLIVHHGCWPYVNEVIGVAFRYPNVHLVPDMYLFQPGTRLYVDAANSFLRDQFLFATSFPFRAMKQTVDDFLRLGFSDDVLDNLLAGNAQRLLKL